VAAVSKLSQIVSDHQLMAVSEIEQDIVTQLDRSSVMKAGADLEMLKGGADSACAGP